MKLSIFLKTPLILKLQRNKFINLFFKKLRINVLLDKILNFFPITKKLPHDLHYKIRSVASLVAANEVFKTNVYRDFIKKIDVNSFLDLGCNVGFFPILLSELKLKNRFFGLMIDGNPAVLAEAEEHLKINYIQDVKILHGLVGFSSNEKEADFFINEFAHIASTATGKNNPDVPCAGKINKLKVKCLNIENEWVKHFGLMQIDLVKIDIEGMELEFFRNSPNLLARCKNLIFEWHKWQVSINDCNQLLCMLGFNTPSIIWEDDQHGVAYCSRKTNNNNQK